MPLGQRGHDLRVLHDEGWIDASFLQKFTDQLWNKIRKLGHWERKNTQTRIQGNKMNSVLLFLKVFQYGNLNLIYFSCEIKTCMCTSLNSNTRIVFNFTLSRSLAAVLGGEQSTLCLTQSKSSALRASSVCNSSGSGNLQPRIRSRSGNIRRRRNGGVKSTVHSGPSGPSGWYVT